MSGNVDLEKLVSMLREQGVLLATGLTDEEVARVESTFGFRFPPDLKAFLRYALPVSSPEFRKEFPNWREAQKFLKLL